MAGRLRYSQGTVTVEMTDTLDRLAREAIERTQPGLIDAITRTMEPIFRDAVSRWPVRTGKSKAALDWYLAIDDGGKSIRGVITTGGVEYSYYIRPRSLFNGSTGWAEWIQRPVRRSRAKLAAELGPMIATRLVRGGA